MIDPDRFVQQGRARWQRLEALVAAPTLQLASEWSELSVLYRAVCTDLSRARAEDLPEEVVTHLDVLAARAHNRLYATRRRVGVDVVRFLTHDVPGQVRASWDFVLLSAVLFFGPWALGMAGAYVSEDFALAVVDEGSLRQFEALYEGPSNDRTASASAMMTGFYVYNNVGIAFRCFSTGVLGGLGSVFFLVQNGVVIGTVFGHLLSTGRGWNLLEFTAGHSAWELLGIVLSGAAGLRMGWALIATEGRTRLASLRGSADEIYRMVAGAAFMILVAALIEGLWSASPAPLPLKLLFGVAQFCVVLAWWGLSGRSRS